MQRPSIDIALFTAALLLGGCSGTARRPLDWTDAPTVSPADASAYVGREVRMVGTVESAEASEGRAVLMLDDRSGERIPIVIAPPLIGPRPTEIAERFRGREVEARGRIDDLGGATEMLIGDPEQVRVLDGTEVAAAAPSPRQEAVARAAPPAAAPAAAAPAVPAPAAAAPRVATRTVSATETAAERPQPSTSPVAVRATTAAEPAQPPSTSAPHAATAAAATSDSEAACTRAHSAWQAAAAAARAPLARLDRCLATRQPPCRREADALREALAEVAAAEERVAWLCSRER
jgi:hypothetical protein